MTKQTEPFSNLLSNLRFSKRSLLETNNAVTKQIRFYWPEIREQAKEQLSRSQHGSNIGRISERMMSIDEINIDGLLHQLNGGKLSKKAQRTLFDQYCTILNLFLLFTEKEEIKVGQNIRQFATLLNRAESFEDLDSLLKKDKKTLHTFLSGLNAKILGAPSTKRLLSCFPKDMRDFSLRFLNTVNNACCESALDFSSPINFLSKFTAQNNISSAYLLLLGFAIVSIGFLASVLKDIKNVKFDLFDLEGAAFLVALGCLFTIASISAPATPTA